MRDPALFAEPDRFYPERWLSPGAPAFPNQVFGFGARQCPGRFFARESMWSTMVGILAAFDIAPTEDGPPEEEYLSGSISCVASLRLSFYETNEKLMIGRSKVFQAVPVLYSTAFGSSSFVGAGHREWYIRL
jgi:hypothetical protein